MQQNSFTAVDSGAVEVSRLFRDLWVLGRAWVRMEGEDLRITERHAGVQSVGDRCVS